MAKLNRKLLRLYLSARLNRIVDNWEAMKFGAKDQGWPRMVWIFLVDPWLNGCEYSPGMILHRIFRLCGWAKILWHDIDFDAHTLTNITIYKLERVRKVLMENWPIQKETILKSDGMKEVDGEENAIELLVDIDKNFIGNMDETIRWDREFRRRLSRLDDAISLLKSTLDTRGLQKDASRLKIDWRELTKEQRSKAFSIISDEMDGWWD
jgi:hypothetical protein